VFLVERISDGTDQPQERRTLLLQVKENGDILQNGQRVSRVHPFPMRAGRGEVRNGHVVFEGIPQKPTVISTRPA
jgi:hypothetical protein